MTAQLKEMIMTGVGALDLNFSSNTVDFQTFDINFVYNILEIKSIATERVRAIPVSTSPAPVCLPAKILLNGKDALDAPSGVRTDIRVLREGEAIGDWNGRELIIPPCEDAQWELINTVGDQLDSGSISSGGSGIIIAPPVTVLVNDVQFAIVPSNKTINVPVPEPINALTDSTQAPVYYIGWTEDGNIYYITRITMNLNVATTAEAVGAWADRYTLIYT